MVSLSLSTGLRGTQRHLRLWWLRAVLRSVRLAYRRHHRCRLPLWNLRWGLQQVQSVRSPGPNNKRRCLEAFACCLSLWCVRATQHPCLPGEAGLPPFGDT